MAEAEKPAAAARARPRLERILSAFRGRDWAGITIELLVVTLGVLLAFQIDQWAQNRRQAREDGSSSSECGVKRMRRSVRMTWSFGCTRPIGEP